MIEGECSGERQQGRQAVLVMHHFFKSKIGSFMEGFWKYEMLNGHGRTIYASGDVYLGQYKNDLRHGSGKLTCADGITYEG